MNINKISGFCLIGTGVYAIGIVWLGILLIAGAGLFIIFHENSKNRKNETIIGNRTI